MSNFRERIEAQIETLLSNYGEEYSDELKEKWAQAIHKIYYPEGPTWDELSINSKASYRKQVDIVLTALQSVAPEPEYEWAVRWPLSEEAHGKGRFRWDFYASEEDAREDMDIFPFGELRRRVKTPWEEVDG